MSSKNDPAFPVASLGNQNERGLSRLDWFTGMALQTLRAEVYPKWQNAEFENRMNELVAQLNAIEAQTKSSDIVRWKDRGRKFAAIDIGSSGAWLVEKTTGEILNIKSYGVPDYNKKAKADIGNIWTVDPEVMHKKRWNYGR